MDEQLNQALAAIFGAVDEQGKQRYTDEQLCAFGGWLVLVHQSRSRDPGQLDPAQQYFVERLLTQAQAQDLETPGAQAKALADYMASNPFPQELLTRVGQSLREALLVGDAGAAQKAAAKFLGQTPMRVTQHSEEAADEAIRGGPMAQFLLR